MTVPPVETGRSAGKRPCPYCGVWNELEYAYCEKCGRSLPPRERSAVPPQAGLPPPPPDLVPAGWAVPPPPDAVASAGPEPEDTPAFDRPLTEAEDALLRGALQRQPVRLTRFLGAFVGIMPLAMIGMAAMGTPFIPENYIAIVLVTSVLAVVLAGASQRLRMPIVKALTRGLAREVWGVPEIRQATAAERTVALAGIEFRMGNGLADRLLPERMNRLVYVDAGPGGGPAQRRGYLVAWVLDWNGTPATKLDACHVSDATGRLPEPPGAPAIAFKGGMRK